ncbi:hypothetical protein C474_06957 [Halogeometricum pallidum JCM 14848]|uniref:Uncharacterized protein n=1 Tax=Halogeometricum pallidum JCM 14848 TaxID=1227487 RepID=M0DEH1_HALPD|nr:hypothetical protein [Halogeometricum pallidum]ELZ32539.1 hypothetical protein C474_06957 [Halogeometricum pallidum JCM 14848]
MAPFASRMAAIPSSIEVDSQPPMAVPLGHFVVGLCFLLGGGLVGVLGSLGALPGQRELAHVHLLLVGWVCVTIMGAMTQFVPVWSGTALHSERLSRLQLLLVAPGLLGFVICLLGGFYGWLSPFGGLLLLGFWLFVYNVGRTLLAARPWDVTERHFALALGYLAVVTAFGLTLAVGFTRPVLGGIPITRSGLHAAHATLAVFGVVLTTVFGALYQLGTMFTQSDLRGVDFPLRRVEEVGYPVGVVALALGRLFDAPSVGRLGALLVVAGVVAFGVVLARRLVGATVEWTPMLSRYAVAAAAMLAWAALTAPVWVADPLSPAALFGAPSSTYLLLFGVVGFVVFGTLYHVVPFIVWVHRYSDLLGLGDVPAIDDLYDDRLAAVDFAALLGGFAVLGLTEFVALPRLASSFGGTLALLGFVVFVANLLSVIRTHGSASLFAVLLPEAARGTGGEERSDGAVERESTE